MMTNQDNYQELFQLEPELVEIYNIYKRTREVYRRTKVALGRTPTFSIAFSNAKEVKVSHGTNYSTKIYTSNGLA